MRWEKTDSPRMDDHERILIEAALYVAGRPLDTKTLGSIIGTRSKRTVRKLARALLKEYIEYDDALEMVELEGDQFALQLKPRYVKHVRRLSMRPSLTIGPLKTLSYIAFNQPVVQSHVAKVRGSNAYKHIQALEELDLIATEKMGKTKIIRTTDAFLDYLNLSHNPRLMKGQLNALIKSPPKKRRSKG
jgi:segregation and condensation protein B